MLILSYHRVADVHSDPWGLCVTPDHFARQMEVLRAEASPMPLADMVAAIRAGAAPPHAVAVTFDDGYVDNLVAAKPCLARREIPATVFITTGYVASGRQFWWDALHDVLLGRPTLPPSLALEIDGTTHRWELGTGERLAPETMATHRNWRAWTPAPTPRHALYVSVWNLLRPLAEAPRLDVLDRLTAWADSAGGQHTADRPTTSPDRAVTPLEMTALADGGLIALGAHTITHPLLTSLSPTAQREEIAGSRTALEDLTGACVSTFAYPFGDCDAQTLAAVADAGLALACAGGPGRVDRASDPLRLPRVQVDDWDAEEFRGRLADWFRG